MLGSEIKKKYASGDLNVVPDSPTESSFILETMGNIPSSALQFGKDLINPILNPIETASTILQLGSGIVQLAIPGEQNNEELVRQVGQFFADRYGGAENIKRTIKEDPVGFLGDIALVFTGTGAAVRGTGTGLKAAGAVKAGEAVEKAGSLASATGKYTDPTRIVGQTLGTVTELAGKGTTAVIGRAVGVGSEPYKRAFEGGDDFTRAFKGEVDEVNIVDATKEGLDRLKSERNRSFKSEQAKVYPSMLKKKIPEDVKEDLFFAVDTYRESERGQATISPIGKISEAELAEIEQVVSLISDADNLVDLANIMVQLNEVGNTIKPGTKAYSAFAEIKNTFKKKFDELAPEGYKDYIKEYSQQSKSINELIAELSLSGKSKQTAFNKISRALQNPNSVLGKTLRNLDPDTVNTIEELGSGYLLSQGLPPGLSRSITASLGPGVVSYGLAGGSALPALATAGAGLAMVSPKVTGQVARGAGKLKRGITDPISRAYGRNRLGALVSGELGAISDEMADQGLLGLPRIIQQKRQGLL